MMKRFTFIVYQLAMVIVVALLACCSSEEFINDAALETDETSHILFQTNTSALTRSAVTGADAAAKLGYHFIVYGTKHRVAENAYAANDQLVFNHYNVSWESSTPGSTSTDMSWKYNGNTSYSPNISRQEIKYWDYGAASGYTFYAFSSRDISYPAQDDDPIVVSKITSGTDMYQKGYSVTIKNGADFQNLYFSDRMAVAKTNFNQPVQFNFRSFGAKVRVGFYETIPGYKVKIKRFYYKNSAVEPVTSFDDMNDADAVNFRAAIQNVRTTADENKFSIVYNQYGDIKNRPSVVNTTVAYGYTLSLGNNLQGKELGTTSNTATYDSKGGAFTDVMPFEQITNPMLLKCDYVLESEDGQGETLEITGAKVSIPIQYLQWSGNSCYTYLFKITERSNGTTGLPDDPEGLYEISFDAISVSTDVNDQSTLTAVDKFDITSYRTGQDVYLINTNKTDGSVIVPSSIGDESTQVQVYLVSTSDADIDEVNINAHLMGANNGISLEPLKITSGAQAGQFAAELCYLVPASDGTYYTFGDLLHPGALHFTSEMGHAYAYVYCATKHVNATYSKVAADAVWNPAITYYTYSSGVYTAASGVTEAYFNANKSSLYIQTYPGTPGEYAVMLLDTRGY